jgi:hypothetical protein
MSLHLYIVYMHITWHCMSSVVTHDVTGGFRIGLSSPCTMVACRHCFSEVRRGSKKESLSLYICNSWCLLSSCWFIQTHNLSNTHSCLPGSIHQYIWDRWEGAEFISSLAASPPLFQDLFQNFLFVLVESSFSFLPGAGIISPFAP